MRSRATRSARATSRSATDTPAPSARLGGLAATTRRRCGSHSTSSSRPCTPTWSHRAAAELAATGATRQRDSGVGAASLTPQEREVALLAATGLTNREIAARLYMSHRTVSSHLSKIFSKLGIRSRAALRDALSDAPETVI